MTEKITEFLNLRFPLDIPLTSIVGPQYNTTVVTTFGGSEQRNINWSHAKRKFIIAKGIYQKKQIDDLITFFHLCKGKASSFLIRDWSDYQVKDQVMNLQDDYHNSSSYIQLYKEYKIGSYIYRRKIHHITPNSITIKNSDGDEISDNLYQVNFTQGMITLNKVLFSIGLIYITFDFDIVARFDLDYLSIKAEGNMIYANNDIPIVEIISS